ncbi:DUF1293 family protein [Vibrio metschnikovii]|uniref:DUF1293 family protein n=1 Tax=Vibrio metschnikovii TaxID=28172 RepID=UPI001C30070C|nr:DUF1293 family protein [Vibrio metschnikovii]
MARIFGIRRMQYPNNPNNNKPFYELVVVRPIENVDAENFKKSGYGLDTEIPYKKEPLKVVPEYAQSLIDTGAFVPDREYSIEFTTDPNDIYTQLVSKLIPHDEDIKKHFAECFKK